VTIRQAAVTLCACFANGAFLPEGHALNRAVARLVLFENNADCEALDEY
jgi:hypothetical protein